MDTERYHTLSVVLAIVCFIIILLVGVLSSILREEARKSKPYAPYSFSRCQLWLWTLIIVPLFSLNWGYVNQSRPTINKTSLLLLSISGAVTLTSAVITAVHIQSPSAPSNLKLRRDTVNFFYDILTDDTNQFSISRLQNLVFTVVFAVIYTAYFFTNNKNYIDFDDFAFILMGISSGTYLFAKGVYK